MDTPPALPGATFAHGIRVKVMSIHGCHAGLTHLERDALDPASTSGTEHELADQPDVVGRCCDAPHLRASRATNRWLGSEVARLARDGAHAAPHRPTHHEHGTAAR